MSRKYSYPSHTYSYIIYFSCSYTYPPSNLYYAVNKSKMSGVIKQAEQAYEQREVIKEEIQKLKEADEKEEEEYQQKVKELKQLIGEYSHT